MKKCAVFLLCILLALTLLACNHDTDLPPETSPDTTPAETLPPVTSDTDETTPAETADPSAELTVPEILAARPYDAEEVYAEGVDWIAKIADGIDDTFRYWQDAEIVRFTFLHSFETGYASYALFDILGSNGQPGFLIYDCERSDSSVFAAGQSPFSLFDSDPEKDPVLAERIACAADDGIYYFYQGLSYGCGLLNGDGTVEIHNLRDCCGEQCITVASFPRESPAPLPPIVSLIEHGVQYAKTRWGVLKYFRAPVKYDREELGRIAEQTAAGFAGDAQWESLAFSHLDFLYSPATGNVTCALFYYFDADTESHGYVIYDLAANTVAEYDASPAPYYSFDSAHYARAEDLVEAIYGDGDYEGYARFYAPGLYGYGVLRSDGTVDIYDITAYLSTGELTFTTKDSFGE